MASLKLVTAVVVVVYLFVAIVLVVFGLQLGFTASKSSNQKESFEHEEQTLSVATELERSLELLREAEDSLLTLLATTPILIPVMMTPMSAGTARAIELGLFGTMIPAFAGTTSANTRLRSARLVLNGTAAGGSVFAVQLSEVPTSWSPFAVQQIYSSTNVSSSNPLRFENSYDVVPGVNNTLQFNVASASMPYFSDALPTTATPSGIRRGTKEVLYRGALSGMTAHWKTLSSTKASTLAPGIEAYVTVDISVEKWVAQGRSNSILESENTVAVFLDSSSSSLNLIAVNGPLIDKYLSSTAAPQTVEHGERWNAILGLNRTAESGNFPLIVRETGCYGPNANVSACAAYLGTLSADSSISQLAQSVNNGVSRGGFFLDKETVAAVERVKIPGVSETVYVATFTPKKKSSFEVTAEFIIVVVIIVITLPLVAEGVLKMNRGIFKSMQTTTMYCDEVSSLDFSCLSEEEVEIYSQEIEEFRDLNIQFFEMVYASQSFSSYLSKAVLRDLLESGALEDRTMDPRILTIMFTDIAGFTTLCESLSTEDLMELAEKYFNVCSRTLVIHGCTIDKYIGDAIVGFWGAPLEYDIQGHSACAAALHLQTVVSRLEPIFQERGAPLSVRVGLNRGGALVGNIGCDARVTYTAIGASVNDAALLEERNKRFKSKILVSEAVARAAELDSSDLFVFRCVGTIQDNFPAYQLVGLVRGSVSECNAMVARQNNKGKDSVSVVSDTRIINLETSSARSEGSSRMGGASAYGGASSYKGSSAPSNSVGQQVTRLLKKKAMLSKEEEITVIGTQYHIGTSDRKVLNRLSDAMYKATVEGDLSTSVEELESIVAKDGGILGKFGIDLKALDTQVNQLRRQKNREAGKKITSPNANASSVFPSNPNAVPE